MNRRSVAALALGTILAITGLVLATGAAIGGTSGRNGPATAGTPASAAKAPKEKKNKGKVMWIVVNEDGTKVRSYPESLESAFLGNTSEYEVKLPINVTHCAYVGSPGATGNGGAIGQRILTVASRLNTPDAVYVLTEEPGGTNAASPFHLAIIC